MLWVGAELARARITTSPAFRAFAFRPWDPGPFGPESLLASEDMGSPLALDRFAGAGYILCMLNMSSENRRISCRAQWAGGLARRPVSSAGAAGELHVLSGPARRHRAVA